MTKGYPPSFILVVLILSLLNGGRHLTSAFTSVINSSNIDLVERSKDSVSVSHECQDEKMCRTSFDDVTCVEAGVCSQTTVCAGRSDFPSAENPLQYWEPINNQAGCTIEEGKPNQSPSGTFQDPFDWTLNVNGTAGLSACFVKRNSSTSEIFTISFWLKASCSNCSILEFPVSGGESIHVRVVNNTFCVNIDETLCSAIDTSDWTRVSLRIIRGQMSVFLGEASVISKSSTTVENISNIYVGSEEIARTGDSYSLYDVRYYNDALSNREIKEKLVSGMVDPLVDETQCVCPVDFPDTTDGNSSLCTNGSATVPRFTFTTAFNDPEAIIDGNPSTHWASADHGPVNITIHFNDAFVIELLTLTFHDNSEMPGSLQCTLFVSGAENYAKNLICQQQTCQLDLPALDPANITRQDYDNRKVYGLSIILQRASNSASKSFILSDLNIIGNCDCNGNSDTCNLDPNGYSCECLTDTHTSGSTCGQCMSNYYRQTDEFSCAHPCDCQAEGVLSDTLTCQQIGGQCRCKSNVEGQRCDTCKPWTHSLDGTNPDGCTSCTCSQTGALACSKTTGDCSCKANTELPNCNACSANFYNLTHPEGCQPCSCNTGWSEGPTCEQEDGQCKCKPDVTGRSCDSCKSGFSSDQGCTPCDCDPAGIEYDQCDSSGQCACRGGLVTDKKCTPVVTSIDPLYGPRSGGTQVTIYGHLLGNSTQSLSVALGDEQQTVILATDSKVIFETKQTSPSSNSYQIKLRWKGHNAWKDLGPQNAFRVTPSPNLDEGVYSQKNGGTYLSGGCVTLHYGSNLGSVKYPRLEFRNEANTSNVASTGCKLKQDGSLLCRTPDLRSIFTSSASKYTMRLVLDGAVSSETDLKVSQDPSFQSNRNVEFEHPFEDSIKIYGARINAACLLNVYTVHVGVVQCSIKHITDSYIKCVPPEVRPGDRKKHKLMVSIGNVEHVVGTLEYMDFHETTAFIIFMCCLGGVLLIIIGVIIFFIWRRRRKNRQAGNPYKLQSQPQQRPMNDYSELASNNSAGSANSNGLGGSVQAETMIKEPKKGIVNSSAEEAVLIEEFLPHVEQGLRDDVRRNFVGRGHFTMAPNPRLKGSTTVLVDGSMHKNGAPILKLTIKSLSQPISGTADSSFPTWANQALSECLRLKRHTHAHVLNIQGIGIEPMRFHILYPYMAQGTLKELVSDSKKEFSVRQLLGFGQQVLEGLSFLFSNEVTHKDVAARNCMVNEHSIVKLGDGALSWDLFKDEYIYDDQRERYLPLRWMAPESITDGFYDNSTDVWSFGVLVWELLTRGCLPFHEVTQPSQVRDFILEGYILGKPDTLSDDVYNIISQCWSQESEDRPVLSSVSRSLNQILAEDEDVYANSRSIGSTFPQSPRRMQGRSKR